MRPSTTQIEAYRRDGFLVLDRFIEPGELVRLRDRFARVFAHDWENRSASGSGQLRAGGDGA